MLGDRVPVAILGTLVHVFAGDRAWLARVRGESPTSYVSRADYRIEVLREEWPRVPAARNEWAEGLTEETAAAPIAYRTIEGKPCTSAAWQIALHMVNHGTHHRGQVSGFLRALGHTPPPLDLIRFYRDPA